MPDERPGERSDDANGLIVRRGNTSLEARGRAALLVLCTLFIIAALAYEAREVQRVIAEHEANYERRVEMAQVMIGELDRQRRMEHLALDRRLDILSCAAMLTDSERQWVRGQRHVTWDDRCPWITPEPKRETPR